MQTEIVSERTFFNFAKRVETATMKQYGRSTSWVSFSTQGHLMEHGARIVEAFSERKTLTIEGNWREAMVKAAIPPDSTYALLAALRQVATIAESGVIMRHETGKPTWSANDAIAKVARAAIARAEGRIA